MFLFIYDLVLMLIAIQTKVKFCLKKSENFLKILKIYTCPQIKVPTPNKKHHNHCANVNEMQENP